MDMFINFLGSEKAAILYQLNGYTLLKKDSTL
jgi:hypothetical protein